MSVEGNVKDMETVNALRGKITTIPQVDTSLTKRGYSADAKVTGDAINERVKYRDIVDNGSTDDATKVASARQVFLLNKQLASLNLSEASTVGYNNTTSKLNAQNMQGAIDELAEESKRYLTNSGDNLMEGMLIVRNADNGYGTLNKENTEREDLGTQMVDHASDGRLASVNVCSLTDTLSYIGNNGESKKVHHEGNKPFGSYIGDGITNERIIATKGIGRLALVYSENHFAFVTPEGAMTTKLSTGTTTWVEGAKVSFLDGQLVMHTLHPAFNEVDVVYNYQVI